MIVGIIVQAFDQDTKDGETEKSALLGTGILGVLGAITGGFVSNAIFGFEVRGFDIATFIISSATAIILLSLVYSVKNYK